MEDKRLLAEDQKHLKGAGLEYRTEIGQAAQSLEQDPDIEVRRDEQHDLNLNLIKIDLGCGQARHEGFVGMDARPGPGVDIVHDITVYPWIGIEGKPLPDNSVYELNATHVLEHILDLNGLMAEAYRVLIPGGRFQISGPYWASSRAWQDPTHVRALTEDTFRYYDRVWTKAAAVDHYAPACDFEQTMLKQELYPGEDQYADETKKWRCKHYNNVVYNIYYTLRAVKPMRDGTQVPA